MTNEPNFVVGDRIRHSERRGTVVARNGDEVTVRWDKPFRRAFDGKAFNEQTGLLSALWMCELDNR